MTRITAIRYNKLLMNDRFKLNNNRWCIIYSKSKNPAGLKQGVKQFKKMCIRVYTGYFYLSWGNKCPYCCLAPACYQSVRTVTVIADYLYIGTFFLYI